MSRTFRASSSPRVLFVAAGGSGGHIFPALSFIRAVKDEDPSAECHFFCGTKALESQLTLTLDSRTQSHTLALRAYRGLWSLIDPIFLWSYLNGWRKCRTLIQSKGAKLVAGFGGVHTIPLVLAAKSLGVPSLIHEQNLKFGMANRFLSCVATCVAFAMNHHEETRSKNAIVTGMPMRHDLGERNCHESLRKLDLDPDKKTLLVLGGSQGARSLNQAMMQLVETYEDGLKDSWQIIHLSGPGDYERLKTFYKTTAVLSRLFSFYLDMAIIYTCSDVILSRAGSMTLHELALYRKCAILVPYPGARAHQTDNARILSDQGAAHLIEEKDLTSKNLYGRLEQFRANPLRGTEMGQKCASILRTDGAGILVQKAKELTNTL